MGQSEDTYGGCLLDLFEQRGWRPRATAALQFYRVSPLLIWQEPNIWVVLTACPSRPNVMVEVATDPAGLERTVGKYLWRVEHPAYWLGPALMLIAVVRSGDWREPMRESIAAYLGRRLETKHDRVLHRLVTVPDAGSRGDPSLRLAHLSLDAVEEALSEGAAVRDPS